MSEVLQSYALSPMQAGMLFHSLYHQGAGVYVQQMIATLEHELDTEAFLQAWSRVIERHDVLRTSFHWDGDGKTEQRVHRTAAIPCPRENWRGFTASQQAERLAAYLETDRSRGFDLGTPPLMRLALFSLDRNRHTLLWTSHHALLDGRSRVLVLQELFAIYDSLVKGETLQLYNPRPYCEYVNWLQGLDAAKAAAFWSDLLDDFVSPTPLPCANLSGQFKTGGMHAEKLIRLPEHLTARLAVFAKQAGLTLNTIFQGAWALCLSVYSNQKDVVFGATRACRHSALGGADAMIGLFINTVPVRAGIIPEATLCDWLRQLRAQHIAVREFEHTPLVSIAGCSRMARGASLFDSIVVFENQSLNSAMKAKGGAWEKRTFDLLQRSNYPLTAAAYLDRGMAIKLEYDIESFNEPAILRLGNALQRTLELLAENPDARIRDLDLLRPEERHHLLVDANDTASAYPDHALIHELFEQQARRVPDSVAVVYQQESLTYYELNARANKLAHYLIQAGAGPEVIVGIRLPRGVELLISLLAVLKSGSAYLPLDPSHAGSRLSSMLQDADAELLLTGAGTKQQWKRGVRQIDLKDDAQQISRGSSANPRRGAQPQNLAYVIYTSGSSGRPKGAMIQHRSVVNLWTALNQNVYRNAPQRPLRVSLNGPATFDTSVKQWIQLASGHTIHILPQAIREDSEALMKFISAGALDVLDCTPSMLQMLIDCDLLKQDNLPSLVLLGGEAIDEKLWRLLAFNQTTCFYNVYGPTETSVNATACCIEAAIQSPEIGRPLTNIAVYILNEHFLPVPRGAAGELFIAGAGVARGYIGNAAPSAEKFLPDPHSRTAGQRMYRTGDLCRHRDDGRIEYLTRTDQQIKVRGYRVEPGEVEAALSRLPGVRQAAVVVKDGTPWGKHLVGYVVAEAGVSGQQLRGSLRRELPEYMVPRMIAAIQEMPLTGNGKLDRQRLKSRPDAEPLAAEPECATTAAEEIITGIWRDVLQRESIGVRQNFFDLGGHSLLATQVIVRVRRAFNVEIELRRLFEHATVEGLARAVEQIQSSPSGPSLSAIRRVPRLVAANEP